MRRAFFVFALLFAAAGPALADTTTVTTSGTTFVPASITIQLGDTVRWVNGSLSHTVTSGFGSGDPNAGALFDAPLSGLNPEFFYAFSDTAGTYPYFCRPHEIMGMTGTIIVQPNLSGVPEACCEVFASWGQVKALFE
ncbi:MAG: plastocyanin [Candidatus Eisenbacteria bacterium]|nr:plastocyanin [Candidatus Eisenbacteria bacterium]